MSDEPQVLSSEEVDAILKVTQDKGNDLSKTLGNSSDEGASAANSVVNSPALKNIAELTAIECEKHIITFLRKKMLTKFKSIALTKLETTVTASDEKCVYSVYRTAPNEHYGMFSIELKFLHQIINLLYGGKFDASEPTMDQPGKIGTMVAEKIASLCLSGLNQACQDYALTTCEIIKTSVLPNLTSSLVMEDQVYLLELGVTFEDFETTLRFMIAEDFLNELILSKKDETKHREKDFWRSAIQSQVVDSVVTVSITLPDTTMKVNDFMALREGDVIPISDPTLAYVCLNNLKLFRAKAGQSNNKRVVKILKQI
ncbi:MAG: FliM/FliN family flagellar motor switch protein [Gammaproteobacteria bacterium]|nr:FliM/FliN family flagellar motor switch protein [Gammaproteobacteria bacterium]